MMRDQVLEAPATKSRRFAGAAAHGPMLPRDAGGCNLRRARGNAAHAFLPIRVRLPRAARLGNNHRIRTLPETGSGTPPVVVRP